MNPLFPKGNRFSCQVLKLREFQNLSEIAKERNLIVVTNGVDNPGVAMAYAKALNR